MPKYRADPNRKARGGGRLRRPASLALLAALVGTAGCSVLSSQLTIDAADGELPTGIHYALPRAVIDLKLSVDPKTAQFKLVPGGQPRSIADPAHRYYLRYRPLPNYDDDINVTVNGQGFLQTITAQTKDKTADIILNLVKSVTAYGPSFEAAATPANEVILANLTIDPILELADANRQLNYLVHKFAVKNAKGCTASYDIDKTALCDAYKKIAATRNYIKLAVWPHDDPRARKAVCALENWPSDRPTRKTPLAVVERDDPDRGRARPQLRPATCGSGICYRPQLSYEFRYCVGTSLWTSTVLLPNEADPVEIDIRRAFFVDKFQKIVFDSNGFLMEMHVNKPSELLAISALPVQIISAIGQALKIRVDLLDQHIQHANSTRELIEARAALQKQRVQFEAARVRALDTPRNVAAGTTAVPPVGPLERTQQGANPYLSKEQVTIGDQR